MEFGAEDLGLRLADLLEYWIPRPVAAVVIAVLFVALAKLLRVLLKAVFRKSLERNATLRFLLRVLYYGTILAGVVAATNVLGIPLAGLFTGLGLTGIGLAFALKDLISNFVSGFLLLTTHPFRIGDQIEVGDVEGTVEHIRFRATHIRCYDSREALVPSSEIFGSRIINNTARPLRRGAVSIHIDHDNDVERVMGLIEQCLVGTETVANAPAPSIEMVEIGPFFITLEVFFWCGSRNHEVRAAKGRAARRILSSLRAAGVRMPRAFFVSAHEETAGSQPSGRQFSQDR